MSDTAGEWHECEYCGHRFRRNAGRGRPALYCSRQHRQRAYELRSRASSRAVVRDIMHQHGQECLSCGAPIYWGDRIHVVRISRGTLEWSKVNGDAERAIALLRLVCDVCYQDATL